MTPRVLRGVIFTLGLVTVSMLSAAAAAIDQTPTVSPDGDQRQAPPDLGIPQVLAALVGGNTPSTAGPIATSADSSGMVHVFWALETRDAQGKPHCGIRHQFFNREKWESLPEIQILRGRVGVLEAAAGAGSNVYLIWVDSFIPPSSEAFYGPQVLMQSWSGRIPGKIESVSEKSRNVLASPGSLDLSIGPEGVIDVSWLEVKEYHFFADLLTMGHAGTIEKAYHRRIEKSVWSEVSRIQKYGYHLVENISTVRDSQGSLQAFWTQDGHKLSDATGLFHARYLDRRWKEQERIQKPLLNYDGSPAFVDSMEAALGVDRAIYIARNSQRSVARPSEKYPKRNEPESLLEVFQMVGGETHKVESLARPMIHSAWVRGGAGTSGLLIQECNHPQDFPPAQQPHPPVHPLYFLPVNNSKVGAIRLIEDDVLDGFFSASVDSHGRQHLAYIAQSGEERYELIYREISSGLK
jgi:hypothetical protein